MKIGIIIPTYNERENIGILLEKLIKIITIYQLDANIVIVDDNSSDGTIDIIKKFKAKYGETIDLIIRRKKMGLGSAIICGMKKVLIKKDILYLITLDADLSHPPEFIPLFLKVIILKKADLVQGSRYIRGGGVKGWKIYRWLISMCANMIIKYIFNTGLKDNTTNYRVYTRRIAKVIVKMSQLSGYEWIVEALLIAKRYNAKIIEAPIIFVNRSMGKSKLKILDILRWFFKIIAYRRI